MSAWARHLDRLEGAYADKTISSYRSDFALFAAWCRKKRLPALPASPKTVAAYIDAEAARLKPLTLKRKLAAIRKLHRLAGHDNVAGDEEVLLALRRAARQKPGRPSQALGLTAERRDALVAVAGTDLTGMRDTLLVMVGFDTLCRRSELVALRVEDFLLQPDGTYTVLVRRAKNDPEGLGRTAHLSHQTSRLFETWCKTIEITHGPLLRPVYGTVTFPRSLAPYTVARILKKLSQRAGYDEATISRVSGHSLRVGAAQTLTIRGFGILPIMAAGGWRSMNVVARYVENVQMNVWE